MPFTSSIRSPLQPQVPKQFTSFNTSPFSFTSIQPLQNFTLACFHSQLYSFTYSAKVTHQSTQLLLDLSQPLVLYHLQAYLYLKPATIRTQPVQPFPRHHRIHLSHHTVDILYSTLNNHGDITQPCLNTTLTGNHKLTSIPTLNGLYYIIP